MPRSACVQTALAAGCLFLFVGIPSAFAGNAPEQSKACLDIGTAALRRHQIDEAILTCTRVADGAAADEATLAAALIQRGILHGRRWALTDNRKDAESGIADISAGLRRHRFDNDKHIRALLIRGQLYGATGRRSPAVDDFREVLSIAPSDDVAKSALERLGAQP